jgi:signal transduction histidine kinase
MMRFMSDESGAASLALSEKLRELELELAGSQRDLEGFAHVVSHDLRGPLSVMMGFASLIQEREVLSAEDPAHGHLEEILRAGARIEAMIAALLTYLRNSRTPLNPGSVPIGELARKVWRDLGRSRELALRAAIQIERLPPVIADPELLETLLTNLLDNAVRFANPDDPRVRLGRATELPGEVFFVEDNGKGFDAKHTARLFLPFQQLSAGQRGAGVGLATCARIARRHGGQIWAECHPERGTRFFFTLSAKGPQVK